LNSFLENNLGTVITAVVSIIALLVQQALSMRHKRFELIFQRRLDAYSKFLSVYLSFADGSSSFLEYYESFATAYLLSPSDIKTAMDTVSPAEIAVLKKNKDIRQMIHLLEPVQEAMTTSLRIKGYSR